MIRNSLLVAPRRGSGPTVALPAYRAFIYHEIPFGGQDTNNVYTDYLAILNISPLSLEICSTCLMMSSGGKERPSFDDQVMYCPDETISSADSSASTPSRTVSVDLISSRVFSRFVPTSRENFH